MVSPIGLNDALFIDFDGTLAEIVATPGEVRVDARVPVLLSRWARRLDGALAVVSGRPLAQLSSLLPAYGGALAGIHGLERRLTTGKIVTAAPLPELLHARRAMTNFASRFPGVAVEDKGAALAVHYRASPEYGRACREAAHTLAHGRLVVAPGKMVVEILPKGFDKGIAIDAFMAEPPFRGRRPVYVGDDRPDEAGFDYVNRMGGESILVGLSVAPTVAKHRLDNVAAVLAWLDEDSSSAAGGESVSRAAS